MIIIVRVYALKGKVGRVCKKRVSPINQRTIPPYNAFLQQLEYVFGEQGAVDGIDFTSIMVAAPGAVLAVFIARAVAGNRRAD
jgi:hypothetical protein